MGVYATGPDMDVEDDFCGGVTMAWSHYDASTNLDLIGGAGFEVMESADEAGSGSDEHHLWVLARKGETPSQAHFPTRQA